MTSKHGYNPEELRGKKIGVFIANTNKENDEYFKQHIKKTTGYTVTGCYGTMLPNRISYAFDFKGPSILMDTACSSGAVALCEAVRSIQSNDCEAAVVGASHLCLNPAMSMQFYKLSMISDDGKCKSFDAAANGYGRSEAIVTFLLQKSSMARRKYASIVHIKTNTDGFKKEGITHPSTEMQKRLIEEVYEECKLNPLEVSYVEAHGTGTAVGDPIEMNTITDIFCSGQRREPLLVGSVKSNMGHTEPASGLCSAVKVIIAMEKGMIPPNLHFKNPNPNIRALFDGRVKIVTEPTPWNGAYASINSYGLGGVNVHAVLKSNTDVSVSKQMIPQLVLYSGRTEESVQYMFRQVQKDMPGEFFKLLHSSCAYTSSKPFRGYKLIDHQALSGIKKVPHEKRPVWYIFSGMGTHWSGMAKSLLNLNPFAESIKKCAEILKPYGVDLMDWVTKEFRTITSDFVSIATVQIALVDLLASLGIKPDGITGHSAGELTCAYADGCLSMQEAITAAFMRGRTLDDTPMEEGAMAALGVSWSEAEKLCPEGVFPSCNNAQDSVTVSGTKIAVQQFVKNLQAKNIFAKDVDSSGCAFHSKYVYPAAAKIQQEFQKLIPNPKPRSSRWISSTYPESKWSDPEAKVAGATYFLQNLVSPVLFYEALQKVPKNAIVIEIGPHHLLQAILKRVIGPDAEYIGLMKRNVDNIPHVLMNIGRLYNAGLNPQIDHLYPEVRLPAPRGTPMISPLIQWDHSESWPVPRFDEPTHSQRVIVDIGPKDSPDHFLSGHYIDGRYLYPGTGYLVLAWKALAQLKNREMTSLPVHFEGVKIHKATVLSKTGMIYLL
nr:fatty acid synthase [Parasteatoda tepidariorum]